MQGQSGHEVGDVGVVGAVPAAFARQQGADVFFALPCEPSYQSGTNDGQVCQLPVAPARLATTVCAR